MCLITVITFSHAATTHDSIIPPDYPFAALYDSQGHPKLHSNLPSEYELVVSNLDRPKCAYDIDTHGKKIPVNAKEAFEGDISHGNARAHFIAALVTAGYAAQYTSDAMEDPLRKLLLKLSARIMGDSCIIKDYNLSFGDSVLSALIRSPFKHLIRLFDSDHKLEDELTTKFMLSHLPVDTVGMHRFCTRMAQSRNTSVQAIEDQYISSSANGTPAHQFYFAPDQIQASQKRITLAIKLMTLLKSIADKYSSNRKNLIPIARDYYDGLCTICTDILEIPQDVIDTWFVMPDTSLVTADTAAASL